MKIVKKSTVTQTEAGVVRQTAWQPMANELVQCEFQATYPRHGLGLAAVFGAMAIFVGKQISRIRFLLGPLDIVAPSARAYDRISLNYIRFEGQFLTSNISFTNNLSINPTFDKHGGWKFEFAEATDGFDVTPGKFDVQTTAETIAANCICTESFTIAIGARYATPTLKSLLGDEHRVPVGTDILASVVLRDIEGLRQAICDIAGEAYLHKLLRIHGYEMDRSGPTA